MKIKRFFAKSLREALTQVKNKLGPDAVILSNNNVDGGVELVAAIDYDESAITASVKNDIYGNKSSRASNKQSASRASYSNEFKQNPGSYQEPMNSQAFDSGREFNQAQGSNPTQGYEKPKTVTPEWLRKLRQEHRHNIETGNVKVEGLLNNPVSEDIKNEIKEDVINFSNHPLNMEMHRGAAQEIRQEPKISDSRVDDLVANGSSMNNQFSKILNEQQNLREEPADNPFDLDRLINETDPEFGHEKLPHQQTDDFTYSKPKFNSRQRSAGNYSKPGVQAINPSRTNSMSDPFDNNKHDGSNVHHLNTANNSAKTTSRKNTQSSRQSARKVEWAQDPMLADMKAEIESLKSMMQSQLSGLAWGSFNRDNPHSSELLQRLYKLGLKPSISEAILRQIQEPLSLEDGWKKSLSIISRGIKIAETDLITEGGMVAFVGPTGVGKTTTIAKLASRFALANKPSDMALVSMDSFRVGAHEQLKIYAQLLRVPVYMVSDEEQLAKTLAGLKDKRLVLIDTAGMNQNDVRMTEQLSMLRQSYEDIKLVSVLSASAQSHALHEVIDTFKPYDLDGCVITKMDESSSLGGIISVMIENQLPLHYVTNGQKVPEDIRPGRVSNLLKDAMAMVRERREAYDYNDIAMSFMGELLQANG